MLKKKILKVALVSAVLLIVPLTLQLTIGTGIDGQGWNWKLGDFVFAWVVWFMAGSTYVILANRTNNPNRKLIYGIIVFVILALVWAELAVGLFGTPFAGS